MPFIINLIGLGANMALDPLFILGLGQGVAGAAVATAAAQILAGVLSIAVMLNARFKPLRTLRLNALPSLKHCVADTALVHAGVHRELLFHVSVDDCVAHDSRMGRRRDSRTKGRLADREACPG